MAANKADLFLQIVFHSDISQEGEFMRISALNDFYLEDAGRANKESMTNRKNDGDIGRVRDCV